MKYHIRKRSIKKYISGVIVLLTLFAFFSCEDLVTVPAPSTQLIQSSVFEDDATALAAIASVYIKLSDGSSFADGSDYSITLFEGLYSDELTSFTSISLSSPRVEFYSNNVSPINEIVSSTWGKCYKIIYECNRILEGLNESSNISVSLKNQLAGEAKFIRAFCHFYLVNLFGEIPLITTSDYRVNSKVFRTSTKQIYTQIINDLREAKDILSDTYPSENRVRINKGAALALLARTYLFVGDFANAEIYSTEIIDKEHQYKLPSNLNNVFIKASEEAIWQLLPDGGSKNYTNEGFYFILLAPPTSWALRKELYESFEMGDLRKTKWIDSLTSPSGITKWYYPHKYKENFANGSGREFSMVLRLAEQYLIRAEARAQQNKLNGPNSAETDLNTIRNRAGLSNTTATTFEELTLAVEQERRVELFTEWGHRFFDLKRTERIDKVLGSVKPNWNSNDVLLPLPQSELLINQNLKPQNPGY